jgi:DNA-directed RNA polymerase specialized sigma24 family protein
LVSRIAQADRLALRLLHETYYPRPARLFAHLTGGLDPEPIQHLVEETMLSVWVSPQSYPAADSVYAWIMGLAVNHARRSPVSGHDANSAKDSNAGGFVYALFSPLPIEERAVVHFVYTGHACQEIADIMSVSCERVNTLLSRARRRLSAG